MTTPTTTTMSTMTATSAPRMPPGIILNAVSEPLPVYRVTAKNTSTGDNKIHDDVTARRYGFRGALVPGVTVYAYMTQPLAARSEEHTSELQSQSNLVCRLLLVKQIHAMSHVV